MDKYKVKALKNVPAWGLVLGNTYTMTPQVAMLSEAHGLIEIQRDGDAKRNKFNMGSVHPSKPQGL